MRAAKGCLPSGHYELVCPKCKCDTLDVLTIDEYRRFYSEEVRLAGNIRSSTVVEAFAHVPREEFMGPGPWEVASPDLGAMSGLSAKQVSYTLLDDPHQLYHNVLVVLDKLGDINSGQPSSLARWIEALDLKPGDRVYHLGCGVGYYTAILAEIVGPDGTVLGSEIHQELAGRARQNLSRYPNVSVVAGDGATLEPGARDAMLINAGVTHPLPLWMDRLRDGGRLVLPLTMAMSPKLGVGVMAKIIRQGSRFSAQVVTSVAIYSCTNARDAQCEPLLKAAISRGALLKMKSVRRDAHEQSETCEMHGPEVCLSSEEIS